VPGQRNPGPDWRKSSASSPSGNSVEVAALRCGGVAMRDSKNPGGPMLRFGPEGWSAFVDGAREGRFSLEVIEADRLSMLGEPEQEPSARRATRRPWFTRGNARGTRTTHPGVSRPQESVAFLITREKRDGKGATDMARRMAAASLYGATVYVLWRSSTSVPLTVAVALPPLAVGLSKVVSSVEVHLS
jgi:hypothetical protein